MDPERLRGRVSLLSFEFETSGCKKMSTSPHWRATTISLQPLVSSCLLLQISGGKLQLVAVRKLLLLSNLD